MRKIKTTSFSRVDGYEKKLLAYSELEEHGDFSNFVKRLIGDHMEGQSRPPVAAFVHTPIVEATDDFSGFI